MTMTGGCYCKAVRYETGEPVAKGVCYCRECQQVSGGAGNVFMVVSAAEFHYTQGEVKGFSRPDLENPVTREFCPTCGTHLITRTPRRPTSIILKVGTLDEPAVFGTPQIVLFRSEMQPFHQLHEGAHVFERFPG